MTQKEEVTGLSHEEIEQHTSIPSTANKMQIHDCKTNSGSRLTEYIHYSRIQK
ncbi:hypothetical protein Hanom_Chr01g00011911 [Helianthus anomalus]